MPRDYATLTLSKLAATARLAELAPPARVGLDDPAIAVMTDLREYRAATITPDRNIDEAHAVMLGRGVRLLSASRMSCEPRSHSPLALRAMPAAIR